ncbi:hypothetical protein DFH05DRAFT_1593958 [Lentinula detonsa]|uniref:CxC2-like cysteine cluster KDZ transposase-associated domain-containing protein n=1 Tax=Lentinula detonsa TaxID=2804962 RepID=A0A9W8P940_9AGAR|nr:hypothetical protein DFH05DRAFT_1593958 [Lentinula detonsa]
MLQKRAQEKRRRGEDDQIYMDVLMDLGEEAGMSNGSNNSDSDSDILPLDNTPSEQPDEWGEEEEATEEEQLLYFQAKGTIHDFELKDYRTRKRKIIVDHDRWKSQMPELMEAYMDFCYRRRNGGPHKDEVKEKHFILIWSTFEHTAYEVPVYKSDRLNNISYIRSGYLPFNPLLNKSLVSLESVELYHTLFMRCPRLGIQPFIRALCDLQGIRFKNNLSVQFSSAYDLYISLVEGVRRLVLDALGRSTPNYRMLNTCPACQYEVVDEPGQPIRMMAAFDGNNSLKRVQRREPTEDGKTLGAVREKLDIRVGGGDYFLQPEQVDLWDEPSWGRWLDWVPSGKGAKNSCADRWANMNESKTARSFGCFEANGIFAGFCRHSFVLAFADMIRTGEQSKYILALLHHFMSACQEDRSRRGLPDEPIGSLGVGYDIACGMVDKIARSPLSHLAKEEKLQMLIGLLHGYAHNRLCQLSFLMLYIYGAGIEDLEVCERYFSQSNALAPVTRYMGRFRRHQAIASYAYHRDNFETYHNLSKFIYSNYKQALAILNRAKDTAKTLKSVGILDAQKVFSFLEEEKEYLESRQSTPVKETLLCSYYLALVKLSYCQERLQRSRQTFREGMGSLHDNRSSKDESLFLTEREMEKEQEMEAKLLGDIQSFEDWLGLRRDQRWQQGSTEWKEAEELVYMAKYQKSLDRLEGLIVARIFELSRMNISGTGYKMRQHIGHAMQKRSAAIQSALESYNEAAAQLTPPRKLLNWDDVLNYTYLSEFDFLRDSRSDVRDHIWARPAVREAMSELFKLMRAGEELDRLHIEIKRLVTYMKEEEEFIPAVVEEVQAHDPQLAYQIHRYAHERGRFNSVHYMRLDSIRKLKGFAQSDAHFFSAGIGIRRQIREGTSARNEGEQAREAGEEEDDDESEGEDEEAQADDLVEAVLGVANDTL